jgi:hypothetical protein
VKKSQLQQLINIGPKSAAGLEKLGIYTIEEFLSRDPYETFNLLKSEVDPTLCTCALATIIGAHAGVKWNKILKMAVHEYKRRYPNDFVVSDCFKK